MTKSGVFFYIFLLAVFLILLFLLDQRYRVRIVTVSSDREGTILAGLDNLYGKRIWLVDEKNLAASLNKSNPFYTIDHIGKIYPDKLSIFAKRIYGTAYLAVEGGYFLLGRDGKILEKQRQRTNDKLPIIIYYQKIPFGEFVPGAQIGKKEIEDALFFHEVVRGVREKVNSIDIASYHMLRLDTEEHSFIFSSEKEREVQLYQFEQAFKQFQIEGMDYRELDFRFEKPVVKFH